MMRSSFIAEGGGRACNCQKFETGRISHVHVLRIEHTFAKFAVPTSQRSVTLIVNKVWTLQAYAASFSYTGMVVGPS